MANHTLLIQKDGSEIPIDDSGAPIREPEGAIRGVVLVFRDFSEHKNTENRLLAANAELHAANEAKNRFVAALSHELRTPLTPVLAMLSTWETSNELPASFASSVQMMRRNVEVEARLIDDLLDMTRIVRGKLSLSPELVDVHELLESVVTMYQSQIMATQLIVSLELKAARHYVNADSARLQQVFSNILSNAIKFSGTEGHLTITSKDDNLSQIRISFRDNGIGMTQQALSQLFQPFEQGPNILSRYGGLGLGMAISKALVEMHAGAISAESGGPSQGSTFTVTLPSIRASIIRPHASTASQSNNRPSRGLSILLVEDHQDSAEALKKLLSAKGHDVEVCSTIAEAAKLARAREFDLLLSDIGLPDGNGTELVRQIRGHSTMPAIALTGFGMESDISNYKEAGFDDCLTKPVNFQKLEMVINRFV